MKEYTLFLFSKVLSYQNDQFCAHYRGYLYGKKVDKVIIISPNALLRKQHVYLFKLRAIKVENNSLFTEMVSHKSLEEMSTFF